MYNRKSISDLGSSVVDFRTAITEAASAGLCGIFTDISATSDYWRGIRYSRGGVSVPVGAAGAQGAAALANAFCPMDIPPLGFPGVDDGSQEGTGVFGDGTGECPDSYSVVASATCEYVPGQFSSTPQYTYTARYVSNMPGPLSNITFEIPGIQVGGIANNSAPPLRWSADGTNFFGMTVLDVDDLTNKGQGSNQVIGPVEFESATFLGAGEDNCGTPSLPPSSGPPTAGAPVSTDITYDDGQGGTVTDPVVVTPQPPTVDPKGEVCVPVNVTSANYDVNVTINISTGDITININLPGSPDDCDLPELPDEDPPENDEPEPEPDGDEVITGVLVVTSTVPNSIRATRVGDSPAPDSYFPDLGTVTFAIDLNGTKAWSGPIRVQKRRQYVRCPFPQGAIAVEGIERPEVSWTLTPTRAIIAP